LVPKNMKSSEGSKDQVSSKFQKFEYEVDQNCFTENGNSNGSNIHGHLKSPKNGIVGDIMDK
ncbi:MAG: hypothetical protein MHPSP_004591, partial [Paramarteilia canceri]